ncbi:MAG: tetratricopeptide (TPR) repeat protein [Myxococcota bacterium]|jgi:tetratricopeptide (TPR) repeat protein
MANADGYSISEVARLLGAPTGWVRGYLRDGLVQAESTESGRYRLSFRDLSLLRTARGLCKRLPPRRVRQALKSLGEQLPEDTSLSELRISAAGKHIVASDGTKTWRPDSGQVLLDFTDTSEPAAEVTHLSDLRAPDMRKQAHQAYRRGCDVDDGEHDDEAFEHYKEAVELSPDHVGSRINIGRLYHRSGQMEAAAEQFRIAHALSPDAPTPAFNLGVALEDLERFEEALNAYEAALVADPRFADAHYNAAGVCESLGRARDAIEHLARYRRLTFRTV